MKLYISYYENYISIVEGIYNAKKDKYNIKNVLLLSVEDVKIENNEKYGFLKEALKLNKFKSKDVVFSLNTRDVIVKSNNMPKVSPKDLDGIMNNEMYEMMSLDYDQYTFSYEVTNQKEVDSHDTLDVIMAAISNKELETILDVFKEFKLNVERIDTISTAYSRLLKKIEYDDIMILNAGSYGSTVNIYKEDSLFIHDNIPVKINEMTNYPVALALVDEVKGLMNFYSSRNFGKNVDTIVVVGEGNQNKHIKETFEEAFSSKVVIGIENLFDIIDDLQGDIQNNEISKISEIIGSMSIVTEKKGYSHMNLLPLALRNRQRQKDKLKNGLVVVPAGILVLALPYIGFYMLENAVDKNTQIAQQRLDEIIIQHKDIQTIEEKIKVIQDEIAIYDMLSSKKTSWGTILGAIDKSIPYRADLTSIDVYYDATLVDSTVVPENTEENQNTNESVENQEGTDSTEGTTEETQETKLYDQIPNVISIEGIASTSEKVGQFVYTLSNLDYFKSVNLKYSDEDKENGGYNFNIVLVLKEGVVSGE